MHPDDDKTRTIARPNSDAETKVISLRWIDHRLGTSPRCREGSLANTIPPRGNGFAAQRDSNRPNRAVSPASIGTISAAGDANRAVMHVGEPVVRHGFVHMP